MSGLIDYERLGRVSDLLKRQRIIRSAAQEGRVRDIEIEASETLRSLRDDEREALDALLRGGGWELQEYDDAMPGVAPRARVWVLIRDAEAREGSPLSLEPAWLRLALRSNETRATTIYWFMFIWLQTLSFLYERINRPVSAVSEYVSAIIDRDELEERIQERLDEIRALGDRVMVAGHQEGDATERQRLPIAQTLLAGEDGHTRASDIRRRVGAFLKVMEDGFMIERIASDAGSERYRQTLLGAVQINQSYSSGLIHLVPVEQTLAEMDRRLAAETAPGDTADAA